MKQDLQPDRVATRLRAARLSDRVDAHVHRRILRAVATADLPARRRRLLPAVAVAVLIALVTTIGWRTTRVSAPPPPDTAMLASLARAIQQSPLPPTIQALDSLETEWQALEADLALLRPRLPWRQAPAEI